MQTIQPSILQELPFKPLMHPRTVTITSIDRAAKQIAIEVSGGADIQLEPPNSEGNQISIQPVMETPDAIVYELRFTIAESLRDQWSFTVQAAQFSVNAVPAGALFASSDGGISVSVPLYTNLPPGPNNHARYKVGLGFLEANNPKPLWIDDPTIILKPPTDG